MRTLDSENSAPVRKGMVGALAWLLSVALLSLSTVPAHAEHKHRHKKKAEAEAAAPPPEDVVPSTSEGAPTDAPASEAVDAAPPVQGPSPEAPVEPLPPDALDETTPPAEVPVELPPPADVTPEADIAPVAEPNHNASYVLWTASVVALGIGTAYGVMALKAKKDFDDDPTAKLADRSHDRGIAADVSLGLGVILAATGLAFYFGEDEPAKDAAAARAAKSTRADLSIAPYVGRSAGGGNLSVRF